MKQVEQSKHIRKIVQAGLLVALAIVVRNFSYMIYFNGAAGMRIGFAGVFTRMSAILFGPLLGGLSSGLVDVIGYILKPEGAYIPLLTVTAVLGGIITGLLWKALKDINIERIKRVYLIIFISIGAIGIANILVLSAFPDSLWAEAIGSLGKYTGFATVGLEVISLSGLLLYGINNVVKKINSNSLVHGIFFSVMISTGIPSLLVTVANTFILRIFIPALAKRAFMVFLVPRVIEEIFMVVVQSYVISILVYVFNRYISKEN